MKKTRLKYILYLTAFFALATVGCLMWQHLGSGRVYKDISLYLDAETLYNDYATAPEKWSNKYLFNYVEVDGTIEEVTRKKNDQVKLVLKGKDHYYGVECTIVQAKKQIHSPLKLGSKITIQGFCFGRKQNVLLAGCYIVKPGRGFLTW